MIELLENPSFRNNDFPQLNLNTFIKLPQNVLTFIFNLRQKLHGGRHEVLVRHSGNFPFPVEYTGTGKTLKITEYLTKIRRQL